MADSDPSTVPSFWRLVIAELADARNDHAGLNSAHEAWAVILEELEEFKAEVFKKSERRDRRGMLRELIQTAAMCQRAAEDLGLLAYFGLELEENR